MTEASSNGPNILTSALSVTSLSAVAFDTFCNLYDGAKPRWWRLQWWLGNDRVIKTKGCSISAWLLIAMDSQRLHSDYPQNKTILEC